MTSTSNPDTGLRMTPEDIQAHETMPQEEKLNRLSDMKFDLERQTGRGTAEHSTLSAEHGLDQSGDQPRQAPLIRPSADNGMAVVSLISSMTKDAETSASFTLAISRW